MIENFFLRPLKTKKQILAGVTLVLLFLIYQLALKPTIDAMLLNNKYTKNVNNHISKSDITSLEDQLSQLNKRLNSEVESQEFLRKELLNFIALEVKENHLNLVSIPEISSNDVGDFDLVINKFEIEGAFENLDKLLFALETKQRFGKIVNATFKKVRNRVNKKNQLILSVYIQSIIFKKS